MSDPIPPPSVAPDAETKAGPNIRGQLLFGALAALAAGACSALGSVLDPPRGESSGFTTATALLLVGVVPQIVVLATFLRLADAAGGSTREPLRRSAVCVFGCTWLMTAVAVFADLFPNASQQTLFIAVLIWGLGLVAFLAHVLETGSSIPLVAAFLLAKYPGGRMLTGRALETDVALMLAVLLLQVGSLVGYSIWFAVVLRRSRDRFGRTAAVLGWVVVLNVLVALVFLGWITVSLATTPALVQMGEQAADAWFAPHLQRLTIAGAVGTVALTAATVAFFLSVRSRSAIAGKPA